MTTRRSIHEVIAVLVAATFANALGCGGDEPAAVTATTSGVHGGAPAAGGAGAGATGATGAASAGGAGGHTSGGGTGGESLGPCPDPVAVGDMLEDVPYGPHPRQILDLYLPDVRSDATPVFAWIHGGGWQGGSHDSVPAPVLALRERGLIVASIEYRLSDTPYPTTISDVRAAVRWMRAEGGIHGIDPERIAVGGSSAGGTSPPCSA